MTMRHGIDYAFARPNLDAVKAAGKTFVVRYVSGGHSSKDITRSELAAIRSRGLDVCLVWETGGSAALGGRARGISDAQVARAQVASLGMTGTPVYFAVDFDAVGSQLATVASYIAGAASVLGHDLTGVYGGYHVIESVADAHACRFFWQTYAWSYGKWSTHAQLRQVHNGAKVGGGAVDLCDAVAVDFGQFPRPAATKPTLPPGGSGSGVPVPPSVVGVAPFHGPYREGTRGPIVATMRRALRLPTGDLWDADVTKAYGGYLLRHPYLIATGARSYYLTGRAYASLVKQL